MKKTLGLALWITVALGQPALAEEPNGPTITGEFDTSDLAGLPTAPEADYRPTPLPSRASKGIAGAIASAYKKDQDEGNQEYLAHLRALPDCGKAEALKEAKVSKARLDLFRSLLDRDRNNLAAVKQAMSAHTYESDFLGTVNEEGAISRAQSAIDFLQNRVVKERFAALKDACTKAGEWGLARLRSSIPWADNAIREGIRSPFNNASIYIGDSSSERLLEAVGRVVPAKSTDLPAGRMGFLRSIGFQHIAPKGRRNGCNFEVPFEGMAVSKALQQKTHDGKPLEIVCDRNFTGVQLARKGDTVQVQIGYEQPLLGGPKYPEPSVIMNTILDATDGFDHKLYKMEDFGGFKGL